MRSILQAAFSAMPTARYNLRDAQTTVEETSASKPTAEEMALVSHTSDPLRWALAIFAARSGQKCFHSTCLSRETPGITPETTCVPSRAAQQQNLHVGSRPSQSKLSHLKRFSV